MRQKGIGLLLALLCLALLPIPSAWLETGLPGWNKAAQSERTALYYRAATGEIAVEKGGMYWYSNPQNREEDPIAIGEVKKGLGAQVVLEYYNAANQIKRMDSYTLSVANGTFSMTKMENGVRTMYTLGDVKVTMDDVPRRILAERLEELSRGADEKTAGYLKRRYKPYKVEKEKADVLENYPGLHDEGLMELSAYTPEMEVRRIYTLFASNGYTAEELAADNLRYGIQTPVRVQERVEVTLEWVLDGDDLVVRCPVEQIVLPAGARVASVHLAPYFGAAGTNRQGYLLLPDGSGAITYLNSGVSGASYRQPLYGPDYAIRQGEKRQYTQQACLPVFGLKENGGAFLGVIEEGDAHAVLTAETSGRQTSYNSVSASFRVTDNDLVTLGDTNGGNTQYLLLPEKSYSGNLSVRYRLLPGEGASYSTMAASYRQYLMERGALTQREMPGELPFFVDILGDVRIRRSVMGIPTKVTQPMTTFDQAQQLLEALRQKGVSTIYARYQGWFNGGFEHGKASGISVDGALGGEKALAILQNYAREQGVKLSFDAAIQNIFEMNLPFGNSIYGASTIYNEPAVKYHYALPTMTWDVSREPILVLSPWKLNGVLGGYVRAAGQLKLDRLALRDLGKELNSDFDTGSPVDRQDAIALVTDSLRAAREKASLSLETPNAYALAYADVICGLPQQSSGWVIESCSVPFYQLVIHGLIPYAGDAMNHSSDYRKSFLQTVECGAAPSFFWSWESGAVLKNSPYNIWTSVDFRPWLELAAKDYLRLRDELSHTTALTMLEHRILGDDLRCVTYADGTRVYVNYSLTPQTAEGVTIAAQDYLVVKGGS